MKSTQITYIYLAFIALLVYNSLLSVRDTNGLNSLDQQTTVRTSK
jgi:hypothetical protein